MQVLGKLSAPVHPAYLHSGQGPIAVAVGAGWGCVGIYSLVYLFSFLSPSVGDGPI